MAGRPETKQYWIDQLSEYWNSGFTIQVLRTERLIIRKCAALNLAAEKRTGRSEPDSGAA